MNGRVRLLTALAALAAVLLAGCEEGDGLVAGADLKVAGLRIPFATGLKQGAKVDFTLLVKNNGTERITESFTNRVDFYDDAALTKRSSWAALEVPWAGGLAPGETRAFVLSTTVNAADPPQLIFCKATVDSGRKITEEREGNNSYVKACQVLPGLVPPDTPDLVIGALAVPEEVELGSELLVSVTVRNEGDAPARAPFSVKVGTYTEADAEVAFDVTFDSEPTDPVASVYILVSVDFGEQVEEKSETNNTATAETELVPLLQPDLETTLLEVPEQLERGSQLPVTLTIRNTGGVTAAAPFTTNVTVYKDTSYEQVLWSHWEEERLEDLESGGEATFEFSFTSRAADPLATAYLVAKVDTQDEVEEGDEENNAATREFDIILPSDPDLIVSSISAPDKIAHGETASAQVTIRNVGGGPALAPFFVGLTVYEDSGLAVPIRPETEWEVTVDLDPGEERAHEFPFTAEESDGTGFIYFKAVADSRNDASGGDVAEAVEDNNTATATSQVTLQAKPDLVASFVSCDTFYQNGSTSDKLALTFRISNVGSALAEASLAYVKRSLLDGTLENAVVLGSYPIPSLAGGADYTSPSLSYDFTVPQPDNYYKIFVVADGLQTVDEEDEDNNADATTVLVYQ
jgi:subtilase family serine protease